MLLAVISGYYWDIKCITMVRFNLAEMI